MTESERVQKKRKINYDRISVLIDKGGKWLLRAQALREGITIAEMMRRAIYARAGLRMLPYPEDLAALSKVETKEDAQAAILRLQVKEESSEIIQRILQKLAPEPDSAVYEADVDFSTRKVLLQAAGLSNEEIAAILERKGDEEQIQLDGYEIGILRRMLANISPQNIG